MDRRGFVGAALAGLGGLFLPQKAKSFEASESTFGFWKEKPSKMLLECKDRNILQYFTRVIRWLNLDTKLAEFEEERKRCGQAFIHLDIDCSLCNGTEVDDLGETCDHPGGTVHNITLLNSDWIEVTRSPLTDEPLIVMIPDEEIQQIVHKRQPKAIYDRIPEHLKPLIMAKTPIPMSNRTLAILDSPLSSKFIEEKIFQPIAEMQGFVDLDGEYHCPKVIIG